MVFIKPFREEELSYNRLFMTCNTGNEKTFLIRFTTCKVIHAAVEFTHQNSSRPKVVNAAK